MRVTTKGQVTIPIEVRQALGIFPGTEVEFVLSGTTAKLVRAKRKNGGLTRGEKAVALLARSATDKRMTTDEILRLTRGDD
jgi:AbrB family looped-hinge helix DNA binding protein